MTHDQPHDRADADSRSTQDLGKPRHAKIWSTLQFAISLALTLCLLAYLLFAPKPRHESEAKPRFTGDEVVAIAGPELIRVKQDTPLGEKLEVATIEPTVITHPILTVTGSVVACLRPNAEHGSHSWQFNAPEALSAYTDWQKGRADITFAMTQLAQIKQLAETRSASQQVIVDRLRRLVEAGTDTPKDLAAAETQLIEFQIQGRKEIYEAETALRVAERDEDAMARQLQQSGLEPDLLESLSGDVDIIMADVPESFQARVHPNQGCEAKFFGIPHETFTGHVNTISPVISRDRRTLRALFVIVDPQDLIRPGMFAEIGLGTDPREALLAPTDGVVHVGRGDYLLVGDAEPEVWRVTEVDVGEPREGLVEILSGLKPGDRVLGKGAILLKPIMLRALQPPPTPSPNSEAVVSRAASERR